jgi:hypothetical protein
LAIIDNTFETLFSDKATSLKRLGRLPFIYFVLWLHIRTAMRAYPVEGWRIEWVRNDRNAIRFDMKSCFYHQVFSQYGTPELTASFGRVDDLIYGNMSRYIRWQRSKTIGRGDKYCDFCFSPE